MKQSLLLALTLAFLAGCTHRTAPPADVFELKAVQVIPTLPKKIASAGPGHWFIDFGQDAFGWLELDIESPDSRTIDIHLGERESGLAVNRRPGGSVRYAKTTLTLEPGRKTYRVQTQPEKRNTSGDAIRVPESLGVILPFRYVDIMNAPTPMRRSNVRRMTVQYPFNDDASSFTSSDPHLNQVYNFCKYSIKAATAFGIYVDGDRERIPYEADAYINQLSHYAVDREFALARHTHEYLLKHPTWPTEWKQHSILVAHADWMHTGNLDSLRRNYELLREEKLLLKFAREDGLLNTAALKDIVDWPAGERDGFVMSPVNTVVNAFHYRTLVQMSEIAKALGRNHDSKCFAAESRRVRDSFNEKLFDPAAGVYVDGENITHASLHANLFALAFGLVPADRKPRVIEFAKSRGMACSVYPAQFFLEALFENGEAEYAIGLMTSDGERSWRNMIRAGSTITMEAWDAKFKPNLDWNHAWGAAPANIIPRYVLGVRPLAPGFERVIVRPQLGPLKYARGTIPTIRGPIKVSATPDRLEVEVPLGVTGTVVRHDGSKETLRGGKRVLE